MLYPNYPCSSAAPELLRIHHVYPASWTTLKNDTIIDDNTMHADLQNIMANNWTMYVPHLNLSSTEKMHDIQIPILMHISTHFCPYFGCFQLVQLKYGWFGKS